MATPNSALARAVAASIACIAFLSACSSDGGGGSVSSPTPLTTNVFSPLFPGATPSTLGQGTFPPCVEPKAIESPDWVPPDLALPPGGYIYRDLGAAGGYQRGLFVVPGTLTDLALFVLTEWPKQGWTMGRGDSEANEIETSFTRPPSLGAIKAQGVPCTPGYSVMLLVYTPDRNAASGGAGTQGGSPLPSPTS